MRVTLRDYQADALDRVDAAEARGVRRQLGVAATGLGKTIVFCALAERRNVRTLILAHRDELIEQAVAKVREVWPDVDVGVVKAERNEIDHLVVVASVQTLSRPNRLAQLDPPMSSLGFDHDQPPFGLVVVDEAHHATAETYGRILDAVRAGAPEIEDEEFGELIPAGPLLLGVTATPDRGDGKGLVDVFDEVTFAYDILWGIRSGYLCDLRGLAVKIDALDLANVRVSRGDYQAGDAGRALEDADAPAAIARAWVEHALGRRTLVFTPTVATAIQTAEAFERLGVRVGWVSGETDHGTRRRLLAEFAEGTIDVMVNCMVLTEGYDNPRVDCVIVARPTKSRALYTQMVGRGTRTHPDKHDGCLVLDVVGVSEIHSLVTIPSLFGIEKPELRARLGTGEVGVAAALDEDEAAKIAAGRLRAEEVELFSRVRQTVAWVQVHHDGDRERRYVCGLGRGMPEVVLVHRQPDREDGWLAGFETPDHVKRVLIRDVSMEMAQGVAEDYARQHGSPLLVDPDAGWRDRTASQKQKGLARRLGLEVTRGESRGELADRITAELARKKRERAEAKRSAGEAG